MLDDGIQGGVDVLVGVEVGDDAAEADDHLEGPAQAHGAHIRLV
ncbi:hypothetical protein [Streptomyces chryseus]|nr:hypothetical protein [Streptomyces chryseus]